MISLSQHPLVSHNLLTLRDKTTTSEAFNLTLSRIATLVVASACETLLTVSKTVESPLQSVTGQALCNMTQIVIVPILRAGLSMSAVAKTLMPMASVYHLGLFRNETTLKPVVYYNKLAEAQLNKDTQVFLLDPMLATGGSACAAIQLLLETGVLPENIRFCSIISCPEGIKAIQTLSPMVGIYTAAIDEKLNDNGYIMPGLGDAGDRCFGT
ncbi:MAG: uracil phosphoribosyltransferase [Cyanobacteria bacterium P01_H01_bin.74]